MRRLQSLLESPWQESLHTDRILCWPCSNFSRKLSSGFLKRLLALMQVGPMSELNTVGSRKIEENNKERTETLPLQTPTYNQEKDNA